MGKLDIQYHDFENAKEEIKLFSEQTITELDLRRVDDSKGVGEFLGDWIFGRGIGLEHKVTGEELNELTFQIQMHLHSINNTQIKLIKEFGQVYSALEALDKDYIQAILISIKETEETSQGIKETQEQNRKIFENQKKTVESLKKFKQKLDGYIHLGDIDKIWSDCQNCHKEINALSKFISEATESNKENIKRIDAVKVALTTAENKIADLSNQNKNLYEKIESIIAFATVMDQLTHLNDVDRMWRTVEKHTTQLAESGKKDEEFATAIRHNNEEVEKKLTDALQIINIKVESLTHKVKYVYWIAGGSAGLAIIELILLLLKVI